MDQRALLDLRRLAAISFDYRPVAGPLEVEAVFDRVIREASGNRRFVQRLARSALEDRPPTGSLRNAVVQSKGGPPTRST